MFYQSGYYCGNLWNISCRNIDATTSKTALPHSKTALNSKTALPHTNPISRPCTFPPAHWWLILFIHDFSLVIGGKLHSEYLGFSLLVAIWQIILGTFPFFFTGGQVADTYGHTICSLNIPNNSLYNASYYMCRKITSHWQPLFSKKNGGGGLIFLQNWRRWPHFPTKLAAVASFSYKIGGGGKDLATLLPSVLTWSGYWPHLG